MSRPLVSGFDFCPAHGLSAPNEELASLDGFTCITMGERVDLLQMLLPSSPCHGLLALEFSVGRIVSVPLLHRLSGRRGIAQDTLQEGDRLRIPGLVVHVIKVGVVSGTPAFA